MISSLPLLEARVAAAKVKLQSVIDSAKWNTSERMVVSFKSVVQKCIREFESLPLRFI